MMNSKKMRRIALFLCLSLLMSQTALVYAAEDTEPVNDIATEAEAAVDFDAEAEDISEVEIVDTEEEDAEEEAVADETVADEGEAASEEEETLLEVQTITGIASENLPDDSNELLEDYLYLTALEETGQAEETLLTPSTYDDLNSVEKEIYDGLKEKCTLIAAGKENSSDITVDYTLSGEIDYMGIMDNLIYEVPYELYWFDKTSYYYIYPGENSVRFELPVAAAYSTSGSTGTTSVNKTKTAAASKAATTAASVVTSVAKTASSDYDKMLAYKEYICDAVSYNDDAAGGSTAYGDPWQLIYVFDGKSNTNVVCEGYSKAFQFLCDLSTFSKSSVKCYCMTGVMSGYGGYGDHMWNVVHMSDGKNYLVDVTNCDTGTTGYPTALFMKGSPTGDPSYSYLMDSDKTILAVYSYDGDTLSVYSNSIRRLSATNYNSTAALCTTPVLSSVANAATGVKVTWEACDGAAKYRVFRKTGSGSWAKCGDTTSTSYVDKKAVPGTTYSYTVRCLTNDGKNYTSGYDKTGKSIKYVASVTKAEVTVSAQNYTGKAKKPNPKVVVNGVTLTKGTDYTLTYSNNINLGNATVTVTGKGNYKGTISAKFKIKLGGTYTIASKVNTAYVMDLKSASTANGANIWLYKGNGSDAQKFKITQVGNYYKVINVAGGTALDVKSGKAANKTNIQGYKYNGSDAQLWNIKQNSDGSFTFYSKLDKTFVIDVYGGKAVNKQNIQLYKSNSSKAQCWVITPAS